MSARPALNLVQKGLLLIIRWYQAVWSPDHSPRKSQYPYGYCRFYPSCSEYGYQAIAKYGVVKGGGLALWRILRCHPYAKGGHDPVK